MSDFRSYMQILIAYAMLSEAQSMSEPKKLKKAKTYKVRTFGKRKRMPNRKKRSPKNPRGKKK